jgi:hypothetical protein
MILGLDSHSLVLGACLREGHFPAWPPVTVGAHTASAPVPGGNVIECARHHETTVDWHMLVQRLNEFLGEKLSTRPLRRTVMAHLAALDPGSAPAACGQVQSLCAGRAGLVAALQQNPAALARYKSVLVIVVADLRIGVCGYGLAADQVTGATPLLLIEQVGGAFWINEILTALHERIPELGAMIGSDRGVWNAATEMGCRLAEAQTDDEHVSWIGPFSERLAMPLVLTRRLCARWPSVRRLGEPLLQAVRETSAALGGNAHPAIVVAGGGALWPFVSQLVGSVGSLVPLALPELALARGAAWWPEFGDELFRACGNAAAPRPVESSRPPVPAREGSGLDLDLLAKHAKSRPPGRPS